MAKLTENPAAYRATVERLAAVLRRDLTMPIRLGKPNSNLFRTRQTTNVQRLDVSNLNKVVSIDIKKLEAEVEGMMTYQEFTKVTLAHGLVPTVVPELATITVGGALAGGGIESSSFRYGLVHETVQAVDVLLANGDLVTAERTGEHADLLYGLPNTFGTLGYALKVTTKLVKATPFVALKHTKFTSAEAFFAALAEVATTGKQGGKAIDYLDGVVFGPTELVLTTGRFVETVPYTSDYTRQKIYYQSLRSRDEDYLTTYDYLWRWDTDWFWCSKRMYAQKPIMRLLFGRWLGSKTYWKVTRLDGKYHLQDKLNKLMRSTSREEMVIQDVQIPIERAAEFLEFMQREIGISPIWICPTKPHDPQARFPFYDMSVGQLYINFGFWDGVVTQFDPADGHYNRLVEAEVDRLDGKKSLYSESFYTRKQFWALHPKPDYDQLKQRYDPTNRLRDIYDKTVKRG